MNTPKMIRGYLQCLLEDGQVTELRALGVSRDGRWQHQVSGYYNDWDKMAKDAFELTRYSKGVYFVLNPVNPSLLARCQNRYKKAKTGETTPDHYINKRRLLLIDCDPERPSGISASNEEKELALAKSHEIYRYLTEQGWPDPFMADSGNGYHLLYLIQLPIDDGGLVQRILHSLGAKFSDEYVSIDESVFNPSRICKLYGTWARKGDSTENRPHRLSKIITLPEDLKVVSLEQLEDLGGPEPETAQSSKKKVSAKSGHKGVKNPSKGWDLAEWLKTHNVPVGGPAPWKGTGQRWLFDVCPWNADHTDRSAFVAQQPTGEVLAGCQHNGCRSKGWHDLRDIYEPEWREKKEKKQRTKKTKKQSPQIDPDEVLTAEEARLLFNPGRTTHQGNAERLIEQYGPDLHFNKEWGWIAWNGQKWVVDDGVEQQLYVEMTRSIFLKAAEEVDSSRRDELWKWGRRSEDSSVMMGTLKMASGIQGVRKKTNVFDTDPFRLCVENGTLNLKTGELHPFKRSDFITKQVKIPYIQEAECPIFLRFLDDIFLGDDVMIDFIQRAVGYSLTGSTREHCMFILHGSGRNGKSTLINVLMWLLGEFGKSVQPESLTVRFHNQNTLVENADLAGSRLVSAVETEENKRLAEARVKQMTGGDTMKGCFKYKHPFDFMPVWKLWYATNHQPSIKGTDDGIWSRIRLVPFERYFQEHERDHDLGEKLKAEFPGILAWAVLGCLRWHREGLKPPQKVTDATNEYRQEQDTLAAFLADCCIVSKKASATAKDLYERYTKWCDENGERLSLSKTKLGKALRERGFKQEKRGGTRGWVGLGIFSNDYNDLDTLDTLDIA